MRDKSIFIFIFLISCLSLQAQITPIDSDGITGPTDPDEYPLSFNFMVGLPGAALGYQLGYRNIRDFFSAPPTNRDLERVDEYIALTVGVRYKRAYLEFRTLNQLFTGPALPFEGERDFLRYDFQAASVGLGYSVLRGRNSELILRTGVGFASTGISVIPVPGGTLDFNDISNGTNPSAWAPIYHQNPYWEACIEWWRGRAKAQASLGESIRFGIRQGIDDTAWQIVGADALNAPMDRFTQLFMEVNFHLSGNVKLK